MHQTERKRAPNPITGVRQKEKLTFEVDSRSEALPRTVNLCDYNFNGSCDCEHFQFNCGPKLAAGWDPSENLRCYHIKRARRWLLEQYLPRIAEILQDHPEDYTKA